MATHKQQQTHVNNLIIPHQGLKLVRVRWEYKLKSENHVFLSHKKVTVKDVEFCRPIYRIEKI